jgi:hypothetical protein
MDSPHKVILVRGEHPCHLKFIPVSLGNGRKIYLPETVLDTFRYNSKDATIA